METAILMVGVVGLTVSGWFLRGYLIDNPSAIQPTPLRVAGEKIEVGGPEILADGPTSSSISSEEVLEIRQRLTTLEKLGYAPKVEPAPVVDTALSQPTEAVSVAESVPVETVTAPEVDSQVDSPRWEEIADLQRRYLEARAKEEHIDYQWEETSLNFDLNQSYNGRAPGTLSDEEQDQAIDQRLEDNLLEEGERVEDYQKRLDEFASLTKEILTTRLDKYNQELREQQEQHLSEMKALIASMLKQAPTDGNWKRVAESSFVAASAEISDVDGEPVRTNFQEFFNNYTE